LCFLQQVSCLRFSTTAPHPWYLSLPWLLEHLPQRLTGASEALTAAAFEAAV
jgi:hypothetical protein